MQEGRRVSFSVFACGDVCGCLHSCCFTASLFRIVSIIDTAQVFWTGRKRYSGGASGGRVGRGGILPADWCGYRMLVGDCERVFGLCCCEIDVGGLD